MVFDDRHCATIPARRSRDNVIALLSQLARANAALRAGQQSREEQLNVALDTLARRLSHDALVIYIGDGFGWNDRSDELLKQISLHNDMIVINIADPAEIDLPALPELLVSDGEMQISVSGKRDQLNARFRQSYNEHVGRMHAVLRRYGLPLIEINTVDDPLHQLLKALGATK
jgi:uncharacterized protein (DUF58 family)